jgi:hypothetical protein
MVPDYLTQLAELENQLKKVAGGLSDSRAIESYFSSCSRDSGIAEVACLYLQSIVPLRMKDESILRDFVRENFKLLTSREFDKARFKQAKNDFYIRKHLKKSSFPSNRDCMVMLISVAKGLLTNAQIDEIIDTLPFFNLTGERERAVLHESLARGAITSVLPQHHLDAIREVGAFEAVAKHKGKELEEQAQKDLEHIERRIEQKQQEYEALPSVLDQEVIVEPDFNPDVEEIKQWWERFYLTGDPFPLKDGLSAISKDLYEQVIIKTEPFLRTLSNLQRDPGYLFHSGFLLVGDYGFGKTTFIDYLSNYLINRDILPLRVTSAKPYADSAGFMDAFLHKLCTDLKEEAKTMNLILLDSELNDLELEDRIVVLSQKIIPARRKGIVVFMDDYHKHRSHFAQIFEFLGTLQILKNTLTREGVNFGFIVSGLPSWLNELSSNSQFLGFLDNDPIILPAVSPELVCDVFNRRIAAFCYESTPRKIKVDFVRKLVKDLDGEQGIRGCISRIVSELSNNNTAIIDSPIEIDENVLIEIRSVFERDATVGAALKKLRFESRFKHFTNEQIARCLELIVHVNVQNGISESDRQFIDNKFYFQVLRNANLIQKFRLKTDRSFQWNLQYRFGKLVQEIHNRHGLNVSDYLLKLYAPKDRVDVPATPPEVASPIKHLKRIVTSKDIKLEKAVTEDLHQALRCLDSLFSRDSEHAPTEGTLKVAIEGLDYLSNALFSLDSSNRHFAKLGLQNTRLKWLLHPSSSECIAEAVQRVDDYERKRDLPSLSHAIKQLENALLEITEKITKLVKQMCEITNPLLHRPAVHTPEEIELFQEIDTAYYSGVKEHHFDYVRNLTDYLELRLRKYFFFCGSLTFGPSYFDACPKSLLSYAYKNLSTRTTYSIEANMFDNLTRSQFKQIFLENNLLRDHCVKTLNLGWKEEDWRVFADIFAIENIKVAHQLVDTFSPIEKNRYRRYANLAEELLAAINDIVASTVERRTFICVVSVQGRPSDCFFRTIFKSVQIKPDEGPEKRVFSDWPSSFKTVDHTLSDENYDRVLGQILSKLRITPAGVMTQDLLEIDYIQTHYRVSVTDFINTLAYAKYIANKVAIEPWLGSSIAIRIKA